MLKSSNQQKCQGRSQPWIWKSCAWLPARTQVKFADKIGTDVDIANVILLKWFPQHSRLTIRTEGIWITCLKLNNKTYIFFHQKCYQILFVFHQFNKFLKWKLPNFTAKLTIHWEKKSLSSAMTTKQCKFGMLYCHYYTFLSE